jgi:hypothetical protein
VAVALAAGAPLAGADEGPQASSCAVVDIHEIGLERLQAASGAAGVDWWLELGGELLVCGDSAIRRGLLAAVSVRRLADASRPTAGSPAGSMRTSQRDGSRGRPAAAGWRWSPSWRAGGRR